MELSDLHLTNPYDGFEAVAPRDGDTDGWGSHDPAFAELIEQVKPGLVIEVGSWKGASAIHMAKHMQRVNPKAKLVCVDTWLGALEMWKDQQDPTRYGSLKLLYGYPSIYYTFLNNVVLAELTEVIIPFPQTSLIAARWLAARGVQADLAYVDGSHDLEDVLADLRAYWPLVRSGGVLFGDDYYTFADVGNAVRQFCTECKLTWVVSGRQWRIVKP
jgi:hypothetical protein